ncbi:MAG: zinc-ribbon domain-containing protein [Candidatus Gastranaerophilaceae bacterium]|nr:zinc-ribbon domain-containing protein [Candidatus Gastranaerophilaceae bacterium]
MNCPNCGKEVNEHQKFCSHCGYNLENNQQDLSNNSEKSWIEKTFGMKLNYGLIFGVLFLVIIFSALIISVNKADNNTYTSNQQQNEQTENANPSNENESTEDEEIQEAKQAASKRNCIYETSNGVCFTTKTFKPEPLNYYDCTGGLTTYDKVAIPAKKYQDIGIRTCYKHYDYWAGAMKQCSDWGYKLPNARELASLAADVYGSAISYETNVKSYLPDGHKANTIPLDILNISYNQMRTEKYWEDKEVEGEPWMAYARDFGPSYAKFTERITTIKDSHMTLPTVNEALCVYDPNGIAVKSYTEYLRQQEAEIKSRQQKEQAEKEQKDIKENAEYTLF